MGKQRTVKLGKPNPKTKPASGGQDINWNDFRDHLATADQEGNRLWIYPKKPKGRYYLARLYFSFLLIVIMLAGPFIKLRGNPLLMINIVERKFSVLGVIFWPQDNLIFALVFSCSSPASPSSRPLLAGSGAAGPARKQS